MVHAQNAAAAMLVVATIAAAPACAGAPPEARRDAAPSAREPAATVEAPAPANGAAFEGTDLGEFSRRKAMRHVRRLAGSIGVRVRGRSGEWKAARYIKARFEALGYSTDVQRFAVDGRTSRNVVAWWPGAQKYPLVVGGHMDTVGRSPGANDNASGVSVVLELARLAAGKEQARYVRFVAFGAEEYGTDGRHHVGSQVFVNRLGDRGRRRLAGMVSVDMVADGRPLITGTSGIGPEVVARTLFNKMQRAGTVVDYRTLCDCSDNGPFERAGIPAAFVWSGSEPNYHDSSDIVGNMRPRDLARTGKGMLAFVRALRAGLLERFRDA